MGRVLWGGCYGAGAMGLCLGFEPQMNSDEWDVGSVAAQRPER